MKFTYNWLKQFLDTNLTAKEIALELTKLGLELKSYIDRSEDLSIFKVAYIEEARPHPNADKLKICTVNKGDNKLQIVCGAPNARAGIKVVLAPVGANIPNGNFAIKASEIRGEKSQGMLCSGEELLISGHDNNGIIELPQNAEIGSNILPYLGLDDITLEVELTPNRSDCFGIYGIARDLAAKGLGKLKDTPSIPANSSFKASITPEIKTSDVDLLAIREIRNIKNIESPDWLKNLLKNIGMEPISAVVDITNYLNISYSRPMHAYDLSKLSRKLVAHNLESKSSFLALNGKDYELSAPDLVISDEKNILALAGIIGGESSKCSSETVNILLESAVFNKITVSKAGRKHNIISDSRTRFERGIDHNQTINLLEYATNLILEICGGEASEISFVGKELADKQIIDYNLSLLSKRIGISIEKSKAIQIVQSLGFEIEDKGDILSLAVPSWRHDINIQEIIAEELVRVIGYDNIPLMELPVKVSFDKLLSESQRRCEDARRLTASLGYHEVISWSFMSSKIAKEFGEVNKFMLIDNPISSLLDYMRPSIIPNLLEILSSNMKRSVTNLSIFEIGPVFNVEAEILTLSALAYTKQAQAHSAEYSEFLEAKSSLEIITRDLGINPDKLLIDGSSAPKYYHPGRSAALKLGKEIIAYIGEVHPSILALYDIKAKPYIFELFLEKLPIPRSKNGRKAKIILSPYQKVFRDFAFILDKDIKAGDVLKNISSIDNIIKEVEIFDIYNGPNLPEGKKSIALRTSLQSDEKTLLDEEIETISNKIIKIVKDKFAGELRSV